ncbi:CPBP family intramembrane glutamic endopeptidase [Rhodospirillum centenum]|uniref:Membrane protease, putative n=1 Tax=Rhodospirillum centenum (strain ATCC 51521 / SW) TaxID=414684 RepID=B6INJ7_RHOCS|nr:CPBP family intramembrane glutamic endopeptidase [Rhodospirillum centenum]ACI99094.1 membrane protease, putative [Rhodospirillum centenum SW]
MLPPAGPGTPGYADMAVAAGDRFWRYPVGLLLAVLWLLAATAVMLLLLDPALHRLAESMTPGTAATLVGDLTGVLPLLLSLGTLVPFLAVVLPWLHRRPFRDLIAPGARRGLDWGMAGRSALLWVGLAVAESLVRMPLETALGTQDALGLTGVEPLRLALYAAVLLPVILLQVSAEELLFRGYLFQGTRLLLRPLWAALPPALLFALGHLGADAQHGLLAYPLFVVLGLFLAAVTVVADRIEAAVGIHFAQNTMAILLVGSIAPDKPALAQTADLTIGWPDLVSLAVVMAAYLFIGFRLGWVRKRRA